VSDETPTPSPPPAPEGYKSWPAYWKAQGMPWRTEQEIDEQRQAYLSERRAVQPNIERGIYPFRDENGGIKLTRADLEWLLATHRHHGIAGPVLWEAEKDKKASERRLSVDLRGADLRGTDLSGLPLASIRGGLRANDRRGTSEEHRDKAGVRLEGAILRGAHLEDARLRGAQLERAVLSEAHLQCAVLSRANLQGASIGFSHLEGADLDAAHLEGSGIGFAHLEGATLRGAHLDGTHLPNAHMDRADLTRAHLTGANLFGAHLEAAHLNEAQLGVADLSEAHLEGANLYDAHLGGTDLTRAYFDSKTYLLDAALGGMWMRRHRLRPVITPALKLCDVHWGGVDLTLVRWSQLLRLGDEQQARTPIDDDGDRKLRVIRMLEFESAVRANRQLAAALRAQGINEHADRFAYRAQVLQREVLRRQGHVGQWLFSGFLWLLSGYGYRLWRILAAYGVVLLVFTFVYWLTGVHSFPHEPGGQALWDSFLVSLSAIHGRTTFEQLGAWSPAAWVAAVESVVGIVIEGVFVAMLIQRFFTR
jgi:uncharacterized protein YjbI with pentapeptide repeats